MIIYRIDKPSFSFFTNKQWYELVFTNLPISVDVDFSKYLFDFLAGFLRAIQESLDLFDGNESWMIGIKVSKGILQLSFLE